MTDKFLMLKYRMRCIRICLPSGLELHSAFKDRYRSCNWFDPFADHCFTQDFIDFTADFEIWNGQCHVLDITSRDFTADASIRINNMIEYLMEYERNQLNPLPYHIEFD